MFRDYTLQTSWGRAPVAFVLSCFVGAIGVTALYLPGHWVIWKDNSQQIIIFWIKAYADNLYYVSIALALVGAPIWFFANWLGFRTRATALLIAFVLSLAIVVYLGHIFIVDGVSFTSQMKSTGNWVCAYPIILIPLACITTALTIWRIAYRRPAEHV